MKLFSILILFLLSGCFGGTETSNSSFQITNKLSGKKPSDLYLDVYVPTILEGAECPKAKSDWFDNSGLGYEELKALLIKPKDVLRPFELLESKNNSLFLIEQRFDQMVAGKGSQTREEAQECGELVKKIIGGKLVTAVLHFLDQHMQLMTAAADEARKNLELGSRFEVAINQSLQNIAGEACENVKNIQSNLELALKTKVKECFAYVYGDENWTDKAGSRFGCDHLGMKLCQVAERVFK